MPSPYFAESHYPPALSATEKSAIEARRLANNLSPETPTVGVALSGGGIRSATFCLGLFQALARNQQIRRIDLLSTVSGGGYFGGFLGCALTREGATMETVEQELADNHSWPVNWLRENGRFLSPNGSGDNWMTAAVALRNWVALHLVLLTFSLFFVSVGYLVRADLSTSAARTIWQDIEVFFWTHPLFFSHEPAPKFIWFSPWFVLPAFTFATIMLPTGLIYWSTQLNAVIAVWRRVAGVFSRPLREMTNGEFASRLQMKLTRGLMLGLILTSAFLIFALVDSLGQTAYFYWSSGGFSFPALWTFMAGLGFGLYGFAAKIVIYIEQLLGTKKFRITFDVIALGFALFWVFLILFSLSVVAVGFAWKWGPVCSPPEPEEVLYSMTGDWQLLIVVMICFGLSWFFSRSFGFVNLSSMQQMYAARLARAYLGATNPLRRAHSNHSMTDLLPGDEVPLDEYCPHQNGGPLHLVNVTVNETVSGKTQLERRDRKGLAMALGPCGLSVGTDSHALWAPEQLIPERSLLKALWEERKRTIVPIPSPDVPTPHALSTAPFPVQAPAGQLAEIEIRQIEALSLGRWVAISGAAFTTGSGANTHLGLSLLLGLANVRLGYWWDSGIDPSKRPRTTRPNFMELASRLITFVLPVQTCLIGEFFAQFHGPGRRHWYLSDGGHFENTGCYELIRRRVPFIICTDAGRDQHYQFQDLANLVRKARTDFGAEVQIVRRAADSTKDDPGVRFPMPVLEDLVHPELLDVIGTPEDFLPASAADDDDGATADRPSARAKRHALLARIQYVDTNTFSWLLLIKPSLMGDESMDVIQYQRTHPDFPQEPTSDQYFDEAQWESYRKLGQHIGSELFTPVTEPSKGWSPAMFTPPTARAR